MRILLYMLLALLAVRKVHWLRFSKHEVGSHDDMSDNAIATGVISLKGTHRKREVLGLHMPNKELRRQRARVPAQAYILWPSFWAVLKRRLTISMTVALAL